MQMNSDEGEDCGDFYSLADAGCLDDSFMEENESVDDFLAIFNVAQELTVEEQNAAFQRDLAIWVLNCNVTKSSVDNLLKVLRSHQCFLFLPKSYKTLINTPSRLFSSHARVRVNISLPACEKACIK